MLVIVLVIIYQFYDSVPPKMDGAPIPNNSKIETSAANPPVQSSGSSTVQNVSQPNAVEKTAPVEQQCLSEVEFNNDFRQAVVKDWATETFGYGKVDYVNYLDESQLLDLANADNGRAMLILGLNYRWHARMNNFQSRFVRPPDVPQPEYKPRRYDQLMMQKSIHWLEQAALRGELGAFTELSIAYDYEIEFLRYTKSTATDEIEAMTLKSMAYSVFVNYLIPQLGVDDVSALASQLSTDRQQKYGQILNQLKTQWQQQRVQLGYADKIELQIPPEYHELKKLNDRLCD